MSKTYDFCGWATKNDILCSDGRVIRDGAFSNDGSGKQWKVPLVWNHRHDDPRNVLGHAILEKRPQGIYAYCSFNDSEQGQAAKTRVQHGDITAMSIWANKLKHKGHDVMHGIIREVSLVVAGANPGATIDTVMVHSADGVGWEYVEDEAIIYTDEEFELYHSDEESEEPDETEEQEKTDETEEPDELEHSDDKGGKEPMADENNKDKNNKEDKTLQDVVNTMNDEQKDAMYALIGMAIEDAEGKKTGGDEQMKHNVFEDGSHMEPERNYLSHAEQEEVLKIAQSSSVGSFQEALHIYAENQGEELAHAFDAETITEFLPEYKLMPEGEPDTIYREDSWIERFMGRIHKSPVTRVRTRMADARQTGIRAKGYVKGTEKTEMGDIALMGRTTDATTVYVKDSLHRDDIIDITNFDVVAYQYKIMEHALKEEIALQVLVGDQRQVGDPDRIDPEKIRPIWTDAELYVIHRDIDMAAARTSLQGSDTSQYFSDNYVYAEALIAAALYAREDYKGSGDLVYYCTPHDLNVMLLSRDRNGRRIYDSKADIVKALNVKDIVTIEQLNNLTRVEGTGQNAKTKKLHGIFVDLGDYTLGCVKGGQVTRFEQFDIDFNKYKYLMETRLSGSLTRIKSAIVIEEDVTASNNTQPQG